MRWSGILYSGWDSRKKLCSGSGTVFGGLEFVRWGLKRVVVVGLDCFV